MYLKTPRNNDNEMIMKYGRIGYLIEILTTIDSNLDVVSMEERGVNSTKTVGAAPSIALL